MTLSQNRIYLVLTILALASWLLADMSEQEELKEVTVPEHSPDYFSVGYYKKEMTSAGILKNELNADKMIHYSDDETTHLEKPVMVLHNPDFPPWIIKSEAGILEADGDHLLLRGQVFITREATKKRKSFAINTSDLLVKLSESYAETAQWAEIIDGLNRTEGVGMEATFVEPVRLKFLSKVKGLYEFN